MSAYGEYVTEFDNAEMLVECLKEMGFSEVLYNPVAQHLTGYHGDKRAQTAEIIVPRRVVGSASNDIGFKLGTDGKYKAIISQFDSHTYDAAWQTRLANNYAEKKTMKAAKRAGLKFLGKKVVNGKIKLEFQKN